jgi:hypothetical protein
MSERLEPAVLTRVLDGYYQRMSDAIDEHRGQVGSFVGDGIVAYFDWGWLGLWVPAIGRSTHLSDAP